MNDRPETGGGGNRERIKAARAAADGVPGSRLSARLYDPVLWLGERTGLGRWRSRVVGAVTGSVLEIGAGTGLNLAHYPSGLERLVLTEPDRHKTARLRKRVVPGVRPEVVRAPAEIIPFDDGEFDTVLATLVFCTVSDPAAAISEVVRVLKPGGRLLFLEHIRSDGRLGRFQDRCERPWAWLADGCHCNRRTLELFDQAGLEVEVKARQDRFPMPPVVRPVVSGIARPRPDSGAADRPEGD
ncbi:MAG: class I SAM-dependent methyltransferase [Solirubrobacterales bacterium]|nr:class I SAM-dependent methyltransferase [Solirubrobacterales bacterium]